MSSIEIKEYKIFTDEFINYINNDMNEIIEKTNFTLDYIDKYLIYDARCDNINLYKNKLGIYNSDQIINFSDFSSMKLLHVINKIINNNHKLSENYICYYSGGYVYIDSIEYPLLDPSFTMLNYKLHLMFKPEYHLIILIIIMKMCIDENIKISYKTWMNYSHSLLEEPFPENYHKTKQFNEDGCASCIVIYTYDFNNFINILKGLLQYFDGLFNDIGTGIYPSMNIKINNLIFYAIGTRADKYKIINNLRSDCKNKINYGRFSNEGVEIWNNCSNQDNKKKCDDYSIHPNNTRFTYGKPICKFEDDQCKPKQLAKCDNTFINNKAEYIQNKNANKCIDELCYQDIDMSNYKIESTLKTLNSVLKLNMMDVDKNELVIEQLNNTIKQLTEILNSGAKNITKIEQKIMVENKTNKYLKYKLKYLKLKN
jgi:hypothetical protein